MPVTVTDIEVDRTNGVTVTFDDGATCTYDLSELRRRCPCAGCRGERDQGRTPWPRPGQPDAITVVDAQLIGAWGISFTWSDGHSTGIYAWDGLRTWCDPGEH